MASRVERARRLAERRHQGDVARDGASPYFQHVAAVVELLTEAGAPEDVVCAAYLHDVVERTHTTVDEVDRGFGRAVADLVAAMTIPSHDPDGTELEWTDRKQDALGRAAAGPDEIVWLKAADLCANVDELLRNHARHGASAWAAYEVEPARQVGYYAALADVVARRLDGGVLAAHVADRRDRLARLADASGALAATP